MKNKFLAFVTHLVLFVVFVIANAPTLARAQQNPVKHPRVAELETVVFDDATRFLQRRFPNLPVAVTVSIDPLRRDSGSKTAAPEDKLPYYQLDAEEIADEWDDPNIPARALMNRVKKVSVRVLVPAQITEGEVAEMQQNLIEVLNLVPARDQVQVEKRNWTVSTPEADDTRRIYFIGGALLFALITLFIIARSSISKLAAAMKTAGASSNGGGAGAGAAASYSPPASSGAKESSGGQGDLIGDVNFNDPLRLQQEVLEATRDISADTGFPNLKDIITLDRIGQKSPASLGALLVEFPIEAQRRLFADSLGRHWLDAFVEPGNISPDSISSLRRMMKNHRDPKDRAWQALLIQVYRLTDKRVPFLKSVSEEEAFAILARLPKSLAVGTARQVFPGKWGTVLDSNYKAAEISTQRLEKLTLQVQQLEPPRDFTMLEQYRTERELLEYLKLSDPQEEKEIYGASPATSVIHSMRSPFYPFFELEQKDVETLVAKVALEDWAMAMLNVPKNDRKTLESTFSDKQRFMYIEKIKQLDMQQPDRSKIGSAREKIANQMSAMKKDSKASSTPNATSASESRNEKKAA